jgi:hypothetical protein
MNVDKFYQKSNKKERMLNHGIKNKKKEFIRCANGNL